MNTNDSDFNNRINRITSTLNDEDINSIKCAINNYSSMLTEKINLLFTGSALCGKSTTIEMLEKQAIKPPNIQDPNDYYPAINHTPFTHMSNANGSDACSTITHYCEVGNMSCWETLGLGTCQKSDEQIINQINEIMNTQCDDRKHLIDLAIVVHDYSFYDWKNTYNICNALDYNNRVLLAINQKNILSSSNRISPHVPPQLEDLCNKKNIEIVYYNSHDEDSVNYLLSSIIALIKAKNEDYPLFIIQDESVLYVDANDYSFINSSTLITQLRNWLEKSDLSDVINTICYIFDNYDKTLAISNDFLALLFSPDPTTRTLSLTHLVLTLISIFWSQSNKPTQSRKYSFSSTLFQ